MSQKVSTQEMSSVAAAATAEASSLWVEIARTEVAGSDSRMSMRPELRQIPVPPLPRQIVGGRGSLHFHICRMRL